MADQEELRNSGSDDDWATGGLGGVPDTLYYAATESDLKTLIFTGSLPFVDCRERAGGRDFRYAEALLREVAAGVDGAKEFPQMIVDAYFHFFVCPMSRRPRTDADVCVGIETDVLAQHKLGAVAILDDPEQRLFVHTVLERVLETDDHELAQKMLHINLLLFMALAHDPAGDADGDWRLIHPFTDEAIPFCHRPEPHRLATMWLDVRDDERGGRPPISEVIVRPDAGAALRERVARWTDGL